jgi:hypothetical protein
MASTGWAMNDALTAEDPFIRLDDLIRTSLYGNINQARACRRCLQRAFES